MNERELLASEMGVVRMLNCWKTSHNPCAGLGGQFNTNSFACYTHQLRWNASLFEKVPTET